MFFQNLIQMGGFELNHHWHGINVLSLVECALLAACLCTLMALFARFIRKSKRLTILSLIGALSFATAAYAANTALSALSASGALAGANLIYVVQTAGVGGVKATMTQVATFINSLFSGDATVASGGAVTLATVNGNVGSFGSGTTCTAFTTNAKGLITAASAVTCTPAIASVTGLGTGIASALGINVGSAGAPVLFNGAGGTPTSLVGTNITGTGAGFTAGNVTTNANSTGAITSTGNATLLGSFSSANLLAALSTKTGTGLNVFGTAPTIDSLNATTALTLAFLTGSTQCLQVNTSGVISGTGAVCGGSGASGANPTATAGDVAVNGVAVTFLRSDGAPAIQKSSASVFGIAKVDGTTITAASGVITAVPGVTSRTVAGTTDTILAADRGNVVYYSSASAVAITQPAPSGSFAAGFFVTLCGTGAGVDTITPGSGTIGGAASFPIPAGGTALNPQCLGYQSDGTNFNVVPDYTINAALLTTGTIPSARLGFGTNVFTAAANTLSSAGGLTTTIASGTSALGTGAIGSATCATLVTTSATNVATTDVVSWGFNGDTNAVTGYVPLVAGMLTIKAYPTSNNVNFSVCNNTSSSVTPGAVTLNWRVVR